MIHEPFRAKLRLLVVVLCTLALVWWEWPAPQHTPETSPNQDDNGVWLRRHWLHGGHTPVDTLVDQAQTLGIRRLYPFLGPMDPTGHPGWRDGDQIQRYDEARVAAFFEAVHAHDPTMQVLPWTGGRLQRDVVLSSTVQRDGFVRHLRHLVGLGADGVQLNIEPLPSGSRAFLTLLEAAKDAIGPDATLSVAAYPPTTPLHPFEDVHWSMDYTRQVCLRADELVVMAYDTGLQQQRLYEELVARWVAQYVDTLPSPATGGCEVLFGVPAYEDDAPWHNPGVETLAAGLAGVTRALAPGTTPDHFRGVAVYASWTTDAEEWGTYDQQWRGLPPTGVVLTDHAP